MRETSKTNKVRGTDFFSRYLSGKVIDIGCAEDPVCPSAERFDLDEGDANNILAFRHGMTYDTVYSSHCLEHMVNIPVALTQWWSLVRPGGHLIIVVPHEDLYEQGYWPSIFNSDHKASFRLDGSTSWSPASNDIRQLIEALPGAEVVSAQIHDQGYDRSLVSHGGPDRPLLRKIMFQFARVMNAVGEPGQVVQRLTNRIIFSLGCPVDQTLGNALAQIEVIARKNPQAI